MTSTQQRAELQHSKKGSVPCITMPMLERFPIPIPRPQEQACIVASLDKFDALTSSIIEGLLREIELRRKQYEYYRDLLLSFPKLQEVAA
jgi:type I restriction enzyme S subunit